MNQLFYSLSDSTLRCYNKLPLLQDRSILTFFAEVNLRRSSLTHSFTDLAPFPNSLDAVEREPIFGLVLSFCSATLWWRGFGAWLLIEKGADGGRAHSSNFTEILLTVRFPCVTCSYRNSIVLIQNLSCCSGLYGGSPTGIPQLSNGTGT